MNKSIDIISTREAKLFLLKYTTKKAILLSYLL